MNPFDMLIIVILCFCIIRGFFRGFIKELSSIVGVIGGAYAAYAYYPQVAKLLSKLISNQAILNMISFLVIFSVVLLIINYIGYFITILLKIVFLGWFNRTCGIGFGAIKGFLIVLTLFVTLTAFLPRNTSFLKQSVLSPYILTVTEELSRLASKDIQKKFIKNVKGLKKEWKKHI